MVACAATVYAAPTTQVVVNHPTTQGTVNRPTTTVTVTRPTTVAPVTRPTTSAAVTQPVTVVPVSHPVTTATVTHPTTQVTVFHPTTFATSAGESSKAGGSYTPSYKQAKTFNASAAASAAEKPAPTAAKPTGGPAKPGKAGDNGLGLANQDAERDALAAQERKKAEDSQVSAENVLKNTKLPEGFEGKIKQKAFEAEQASKKQGKK